MLRPATPLTILLLGAFGLLILSIISTPIVKFIPLASFAGIDFGVFGFCRADNCSSIEIGYDTSNLFNNEQSSTFDLPSSARATLSTTLIVHPIAALLTLIMLILAALAHFHTPSHSPRYLLVIFILSILTLVAALLSFLIDILLFVPHMAWGSYLVLAATILVAMSGIISCAMRRTLVSRKARQRRINENSEMNGDNFYNQLGLNPSLPPTGAVAISGSYAQNKPNFATFDTPKKEKVIDVINDERMPLTQPRINENLVNGRLHNEPIRTDSPPMMGNLQATDPNSPVVAQSFEGQFDFRQPNLPPRSVKRLEPTLPMQSWPKENLTMPNNMRGGYRGGHRGGQGAFAPQIGRQRILRGGPGSIATTRGDFQGYSRGLPMKRGIPGRDNGMPRNGAQSSTFDNYNEFPNNEYDTRPPPPLNTRYSPYSPAPQAGYSPYIPGDTNSPFPRAESPPPLSTEFEGPSKNQISNYNMKELPPMTQQPYENTQSLDYVRDHSDYVDSPFIPAPPAPKAASIASKVDTIILPPNNEILDDFSIGPLSPVESVSSEFTSISQRGINPRWKDENVNQAPIKTMFHRKIEQQNKQDILFQANPDFTLPSGRGGRGNPRSREMMKGGSEGMAVG